MFSISSVVILYNSKISDSDTLQSILEANLKDGVCLTINIWNNGPERLDKKDVAAYIDRTQAKKIKVNIYEDCRNVALSKAYNIILKNGGFDFFIPLDQDTILSKNYFEIIQEHSNLDLIAPLVYSGINYTSIKFPYDTEEKKIIMLEGALNAKTITSVTSGLIISNRLIKRFTEHHINIFDERFAFYGIDTAFFFNIHLLDSYKSIPTGCFGVIKHSLSTYVDENSQASYRRRMEFLYYTLLYRLNYKQKSRLSILNIILARLFTGHIKDINGLKSVFYCLVYKRHPRSAININLDK